MLLKSSLLNSFLFVLATSCAWSEEPNESGSSEHADSPSSSQKPTPSSATSSPSSSGASSNSPFSPSPLAGLKHRKNLPPSRWRSSSQQAPSSSPNLPSNTATHSESLGRNYKTRVDGDTLTLIPELFVNLQTTTQASPLSIRTLGWSRGSVNRAFAPAETHSSEKNIIAIARSERLIENLKVEPEGIEHSWTFASKPDGSGPLQLRVKFSGDYTEEHKPSEDLLHDNHSSAFVALGAPKWIDATGTVTELPPGVLARNPRGELVVHYQVPDSLLQNSVYPATLDPLYAPGGSGTPAYAPAITSNGTNTYFSCWEDYTVFSSPKIQCATINASTKAQTAVTPSARSSAQYEPAVTYDSVKNEFQVAWRDAGTGVNQVYVSAVRPSTGAVPKRDFLIKSSTTSQYSPSIACTKSSANYMCAAIWGQINANNVSEVWIANYLRNASSAGFLYDSDGTAEEGAGRSVTEENYAPSIAASNDEWIFAWEKEIAGQIHIRGSRISNIANGLCSADVTPSIPTAGNTTGGLIANDPGDQFSPYVTWSGSARRFLVHYISTQNGNRDVMLKSVDYTNQVSSCSPLSASSISSASTLASGTTNYPSLECMGTTLGSACMLAYSTGGSSYYGIDGQILTRSSSPPYLTLSVPAFNLSSGTSNLYTPRVAAASSSGNFGVIWVYKSAGPYKAYFGRVDTSGAPLDGSGYQVSP